MAINVFQLCSLKNIESVIIRVIIFYYYSINSFFVTFKLRWNCYNKKIITLTIISQSIFSLSYLVFSKNQ